MKMELRLRSMLLSVQQGESELQRQDQSLTSCRFDTSWVPRIPIIANGRNVQDIMRDGPLSYLSVAVPESQYSHIPAVYHQFSDLLLCCSSELLDGSWAVRAPGPWLIHTSH